MIINNKKITMSNNRKLKAEVMKYFTNTVADANIRYTFTLIISLINDKTKTREEFLCYAEELSYPVKIDFVNEYEISSKEQLYEVSLQIIDALKRII